MQIEIEKGGDILEYTSRVEEIGGSTILIAMPMHRGQPVFISPGSVFHAKLNYDGNNFYYFRSKLIGKKLSPLPMWIIERPTEVTKIQRREYVRVDSKLKVKVATLKLSDDGYAADPNEVPIEAVTRDISGGGAQLICKKSIPAGSFLKLIIALPDDGEVVATGSVIRAQEIERERIFWLGVKFTTLAEADREKIIRFIFKRQVELRKRY